MSLEIYKYAGRFKRIITNDNCQTQAKEKMMEQEIADFFRDFAMKIIMQAHVDPNNPQQVKLALIDHFEEIYPAFSQTEVFHLNYQKAGHDKMVSIYKDCFTQLLLGRLP